MKKAAKISPDRPKDFHPFDEHLDQVVGWHKRVLKPSVDSELDTLFNALVPGSLTLVCSFYDYSLTAPVASLLRRAALFRAKNGRRVLWVGLNCCSVSGTVLCLAQEADVPFGDIVHDRLAPKRAQRVEEARKRLKDIRLTHWDAWGTDRQRFEVEVERFAREGGDLLVVDALDLAAKEHLGRDEAEWLRTLATRHRIPILAGQEMKVPKDPEVGKGKWFWNQRAVRYAQIPFEIRNWADTIITAWPEFRRDLPRGTEEIRVEVLKDPTGLHGRVTAEYHKPSGWIGACRSRKAAGGPPVIRGARRKGLG